MSDIVPGSKTALKVKDILIKQKLWSQYLEVGIGLDAEIFTNKAIELEPDISNCYWKRGIARSRLGDHQGAILDFNEALKLDAKYGVVFFNRGVSKGSIGDTKGACSDCQSSCLRHC